jgi:hypothetical protein
MIEINDKKTRLVIQDDNYSRYNFKNDNNLIINNIKTISDITVRKSFLENFNLAFDNEIHLRVVYSILYVVEISAITNTIKIILNIDNSTLEQCEWERVRFEGTLNNNHFNSCVFKNCNFEELYGDAQNIFTECAFYECIMPDNPNNIFIECDFDRSTTFPQETANRQCMIYPGGIAWKKAYAIDSDCDSVFDDDEIIVKLGIPKDAEVRGFGTGKYRVNKAKILGFYTLDMKLIKSKTMTGYSSYSSQFAYEKGKVVTPDSFSLSYKQCDHGIHCFPTPQLAIEYCL